MTTVAPVTVVLTAPTATPAPSAPPTDRVHTHSPRRPVPTTGHELPCETDPDLFFPVGTSGPALLQIAEAKAQCRRCPKIAACLEDALSGGIDWGVWGATTPDERRALRRGRSTRGTSGALR